MLSERDIELIRESADRLGDNGVHATNIFYANLFEKAPQVRPLFPEDMFRQSEKLWSLLAAMIESIEDFEALRPQLRALGRDHAGYGAEAAHYPVVSTTLVETLGSMLHDHWSADHAQAWRKALDQVSAIMLEGATASAK